MIQQGADLIDVGGESTRPGSDAVSVAEQIRRTQPVIEAVHGAFPKTPISIDTRLAEVAVAALDAGAVVINDVSALRDDAALARLAAERQVPVVLMHMLGDPKTMQQDPHYGDVVEDIVAFLAGRIRVQRPRASTGAGSSSIPASASARPFNTIWRSFAGWTSSTS